jgi:hypothetical protein
MSSATTNASAKPSCASTGLARPSMQTFEPLLPTPRRQEPGSRSKTGGKEGRPEKTGRIFSQVIRESTSSRVGSPASLFPKPDEGEVRRMIAISGLRCFESYESFIRGGSSVKTLAASLLGTEAWYSNKCILIWKTKITPSRRLLFQLAPSTLRTGAIASGLLATPNTMDSMEPKTAKAVEREATVTRKGRTNFANLKEQIAYGKMLPTPNSRDWKGGSAKRGRDNVDSVIEYNTRKSTRPGIKTGLKLQPAFVEWMMGFPEGWTEIPASKVLEMRSSRRSRQKL